jgi:hypothetical protein
MTVLQHNFDSPNNCFQYLHHKLVLWDNCSQDKPDNLPADTHIVHQSKGMVDRLDKVLHNRILF